MSLNDMIASDVNDVFFSMSDFAIQVRRYVNGDTAKQVLATVIVTWYPTAVDESRGRATKRRGDMLLPSSVPVTIKDQFRVGTDVVQVESIGADEDGMRSVIIVQVIPESQGAKPVRTGSF
jgi:hypothetical protein